MIEKAIILGIVIAFIVSFLTISGIRNYLIEHCKITMLAKLLSCDFCLSFWLAVIVCFALAVQTRQFNIIFLPIVSTPISRFLE